MISVVVPLYNYARYIGENIQSILNQTISDWELIIVDDCSTDNPQEVIHKFNDKRIKYIKHEENQGYSTAKNTGIKASQGDLIVVLDADDMLTANSLEIRRDFLKKNSAGWVHGKAYEFSGDPPYNFIYKKRKAILRLENIIKTKKYNDLWRSIHAQTVMVHRSIYEKVGLYEGRLRSMGDKEMWYRIICNVGIPVYLDEFVAYYRQHGQQMHRSDFKMKHLAKYSKILESCMNQRKDGDLSSVKERL